MNAVVLGEQNGSASDPTPARPLLGAYLPPGPLHDPDAILGRFMDWVAATGLELYAAQEEALLEVMAGRHVILNTPTGSGKSLVALGLHFKALCEGARSYYTSPIKALASEKFFALCDELGAERVGMATGDVSLNPDAPVICCTAEVLSNLALRRGLEIDAPYAVCDEFHYYADPERGYAWQVPLIVLRNTRFLLMSATLGDTAPIEEAVAARTGVEVAVVRSEERPVPLDYEYREATVHETVEALHADGRLPAYIVSFTQRECAELAQALTSIPLTTRQEKEEIGAAVGDFRFDSPYGKELKRLIRFGVGVHHAGLLPRYRLLVEQLSQQALLKVICGTDTLGVGVNIPIRTVLFTQLSKYDGRKTAIMKVRDFKQIAGRAGRKGFDERGSVISLAPAYVVERRRLERKAAAGGRRSKVNAPRPPEGFVGWNQETFERLMREPPEPLRSRFQVTPGMILDTLQRDARADDPEKKNFHSLRELIALCHETDVAKKQLVHEAAVRVRSLHRAGIVRMQRDVARPYLWVSVDENLQREFALHRALSLYFVEAIEALDPTAPQHELLLLTLAEAILEDPRVVLERQLNKAKGELIARLKAEGVPYEERMTRLDEADRPKPDADFIYGTFDAFCQRHPWVASEDIRPKSIGREMYEGFQGFGDYVRELGMQRAEGVLLRYLSQLYKTLHQSIPQWLKTEPILDMVGFFRALIERVDTSLLEEWEGLLRGGTEVVRPEQRHALHQSLLLTELLSDPKVLGSRVRAEMHLLVKALAARDYEEAAGCVKSAPDDPEGPWTPKRLEEAMAPFFAEHERLVFDARARYADKTQLFPTGERTWKVIQVLVDPSDDNLWCLDGRLDLNHEEALDGPLVQLVRIGP